jgi:glycosyltransferase involved in cell wall biosynthesis
MLRILHLSHNCLPDWRVEKSAISASNHGYEIFFAGNDSINYHNKIFSKIYKINSTAKARLGISAYWYYLKKEVGKIIREVKPDIVHAHNIFSAKMMSEFGVPFIYDDHEYWSQYSKIISEAVYALSCKNKSLANIVRTFAIGLPVKLKRIIINRYASHLWTNWENELVSSIPTIVTTDTHAKEFRENNDTNRVFVVPNFPTMFEVKDFGKPIFHDTLSSVYAGLIPKGGQGPAHRIMDGLGDFFDNHDIGKLTMIGAFVEPSAKVHSTGFLSRQSMYDQMFKHSVGLIPFKKHWSHQYKSPNKAYEYAHAGLFVLCTSSFKTVVEDFKGNCGTFEDYNDLMAQLEYFRDNLDELYKKRLKTFAFARNNLIWERYEKNIFRAYQLC